VAPRWFDLHQLRAPHGRTWRQVMASAMNPRQFECDIARDEHACCSIAALRDEHIGRLVDGLVEPARVTGVSRVSLQ
jgi:hypothetical protein